MKRSEELEERKRLSMKKSRRRNGERVDMRKKEMIIGMEQM